jgi:hypothetical protein
LTSSITLARVQQRLARNAAHVQAHAAEGGIALDEHGLHAEVGAAEGRGVATGAGTENQHFALDIRLAAVGGGAGDRHGRRRGGGRGLGGRSRRGGRCDSRRSRRRLDQQDHRAFADLVVDLDQDVLDHAGMRGRDLHRRLVRLDHHQTGVDGDRLADLDHHLDDRDILEVADVGDFDFHLCHDCRPFRT